MEQSLSKRMVAYEKCTVSPLPINTPIILRVDGRAFHTFTRGMEKPFDMGFIFNMDGVAYALCEEIMNARIAYLQSDEISILIYPTIEADVWFGNNVQKMTSVSASLASAVMSESYPGRRITFDSRVFAVPEKDVVNYFIWRQRDWERNSVQMLARKYYSQKELQGKSNAEMHEMIFQKGDNWNELETLLKRGRCIRKSVAIDPDTGENVLKSWWVDKNIPQFTKDRDYIQQYIDKVNEVI